VGLDLSNQLDGQYGHFIVIAKPPKGLFQQERYWEHVNVWVQVTQIGLDAFVDHSEMVAWTTSLLDGAPLQGLTIETAPGIQAGGTGPDGLARFRIPSGNDLPDRPPGRRPGHPAGQHLSVGQRRLVQPPVEDELRWYVLDDRQMYRPGEEVHLKGWVRRLGRKQDGDVGLIGNLVSNISYQIYDPQGNDLGTGSAEVNALGGFDFSFSLPENANLGYAYIQMDAGPGWMALLFTASRSRSSAAPSSR
jgi:alpha-2-macroglobulin